MRQSRILYGFILLFFSLIILSPLQAKPVSKSNPIKALDSIVYLFVDDWLIEKKSNVQFKMHPPENVQTVFQFDAPYEGPECGYVTLLQDKDKFRMYYRGGGDYSREYSLLAESRDGVHWERPKLGLIEFNGNKENNIFWTGKSKAYDESHDFTPFLDTNPQTTPDSKYKAVSLKYYPDDKGEKRRMLFGFVSPDGVHWKIISEKPIIQDGAFDSQNIAFWDSVQNQYVCYFRIGREGKRSISRAISKDFLHWTVTGPLDFGNTPLEHFYTNGIIPYFRSPDLYLGFPMRFVPERTTIGLDGRKVDGLSDAVLITSHDGVHWNRKFMEAYIRPGLNIANWGNAHGNNTPSWGILPTSSNEISIYWMDNYGRIPQLERGMVRIDGFVSINASYQGGELVTKPILLKGNQLFINYSTSAVGSIRVEIQDISGKPLPGFELKNCPDIYGDEIQRQVQWTNNPDLSAWNNKPVRLRFVMKDSDLYSFHFEEWRNSMNQPVPSINPNASPEAKKLLNFIYSISGKKTLLAQHNFLGRMSYVTDSVKELTGHYPAIWGSDFGFADESHDIDNIKYRPLLAGEINKQFQRGAIITMTYHQANPVMGEPCPFQGGVISKMTDEQWKDLLTPGTEIHAKWEKQMDIIADILKKVQDEHIPVLFRPYHEMNGDWFWWGGRKGPDGYVALYKQLYHYFTEHHHLNNLIWVWATDRPWEGIEDFYPGDDYVDILGADIYPVKEYPEIYRQEWYDRMVSLAKGKPIALSECSVLLTEEILSLQPRWTWMMPWTESVFTANSPESVKKIYNSEKTLTLEKLPKF